MMMVSVTSSGTMHRLRHKAKELSKEDSWHRQEKASHSLVLLQATGDSKGQKCSSNHSKQIQGL